MGTAYDWQKSYSAAVLESGFQEIQDRVAEARQAIQRRLAEVFSLEIAATELAAIDNALAALMALEIEMRLDENYGKGRPELNQEESAA
jgi:hypothetical protein